MSATAATAKKQKPLKRHPSKLKQASAYTILTLILINWKPFQKVFCGIYRRHVIFVVPNRCML